jgi:hypothetical protein
MVAANSALGDKDALSRLWDEKGYWYFKGVLDQDALEDFRRPILEALKALGVVKQEAKEPVYSGRNLERFPAATHAGYEALPGLKNSRRWQSFLEVPKIKSFFAAVLGLEPQWVPVAELRVTPPKEPQPELLTYPHQDGFYNEGYRCLTAWMPLWRVPRESGGLVVAGGLHRGEYLHDRTSPPRFPIPEDAIPDAAWETADYDPGDLVIFDRRLPHSGMRNRTQDRFRVSFDVRCILPGDVEPVVGNITRLSAQSITVRTAGEERTFKLDDQSYCRGRGARNGERVCPDDLSSLYGTGTEVMLCVEGSTVRLLREPKY